VCVNALGLCALRAEKQTCLLEGQPILQTPHKWNFNRRAVQLLGLMSAPRPLIPVQEWHNIDVTPFASLPVTPPCCVRYGPRQSERKHGFSDSGRINCEVTFTSWARRMSDRTRQLQVTSGRTKWDTAAHAAERTACFEYDKDRPSISSWCCAL